ncbi:MAG: hypothetical protein N2651_09095 [Fimbriimonadales bacterium]|nr:hypothetical protein [Fimbriimonadales bacterium]
MKTEVELPQTLWNQLARLAEQRQKTVSELIAEAIALMLSCQQPALSREERKRRALSVIGQFPAEPDLAARHDEYFSLEP